MKKNMYIQPIVEVAEVFATSLMQAVSQTGIGIGDPISGGEGG